MSKTVEEMAEEYADDQLIECAGCKQCLNNQSCWIVSDFEFPITLCESCYSSMRRDKNDIIT